MKNVVQVKVTKEVACGQGLTCSTWPKPNNLQVKIILYSLGALVLS